MCMEVGIIVLSECFWGGLNDLIMRNGIAIATWIIAVSTIVYTFAVIVTIFYIAKQLKENKLLREAAVLKEAYDYIIRTHKFRKIIYSNENEIKAIQNANDLEKIVSEVSEAIHEVANCYHYIGFLMMCGMLTNKSAIFEEGGDTFLRIYEIIKPAIEQQRATRGKETHKQYLEYLVKEINKYKSEKERKLC